MTSEEKLIYCFDIDGTICSTNCHYEDAVPKKDIIQRINKLYDSGHKIILFTARGYTSGIDWSRLTKEQIKDWSVKHHELIMGKPSAHFYIDDRAVNITDW